MSTHDGSDRPASEEPDTVEPNSEGTAPEGRDAHRLVALLRGINVGKAARIAMADLVECTEAAGCTDVRTVLATGNVILTDPRPEAEVRSALEAAYADRFGYDAVVQVISSRRVEEAVVSYPFETLPDHHDYAVFSDDYSTIDILVPEMRARMDPDGTEAVAAGPGCLHWRVPRGSTLASPAGKLLDAREHRRHLTTRNLKTLRKVLDSA